MQAKCGGRAKIAFIFQADEDKSLLLCWNVTRKETTSVCVKR